MGKLSIVENGKWTKEAIKLGMGMNTESGTKYHPKYCECKLCMSEKSQEKRTLKGT